jgi:hypothetical protein
MWGTVCSFSYICAREIRILVTVEHIGLVILPFWRFLLAHVYELLTTVLKGHANNEG